MSTYWKCLLSIKRTLLLLLLLNSPWLKGLLHLSVTSVLLPKVKIRLKKSIFPVETTKRITCYCSQSTHFQHQTAFMPPSSPFFMEALCRKLHLFYKKNPIKVRKSHWWKKGVRGKFKIMTEWEANRAGGRCWRPDWHLRGNQSCQPISPLRGLMNSGSIQNDIAGWENGRCLQLLWATRPGAAEDGGIENWKSASPSVRRWLSSEGCTFSRSHNRI